MGNNILIQGISVLLKAFYLEVLCCSVCPTEARSNYIAPTLLGTYTISFCPFLTVESQPGASNRKTKENLHWNY